jgi:hypothetical protein
MHIPMDFAGRYYVSNLVSKAFIVEHNGKN